MTSVVRKIGQNRGKPRLWIEGKFLLEAGFRPGDRYEVAFTVDGFRLLPYPGGERKVSGKGDRPIVDIVGKTISTRFQTGDRVVVQLEEDGCLLVQSERIKT